MCCVRSKNKLQVEPKAKVVIIALSDLQYLPLVFQRPQFFALLTKVSRVCMTKVGLALVNFVGEISLWI